MKNNQKYIATVFLTALLLTGCGQKGQMESTQVTECSTIAAEQSDTTEAVIVKKEGDPTPEPETTPSPTAEPKVESELEASAPHETAEETQPESEIPAPTAQPEAPRVDASAPALQVIAPTPAPAPAPSQSCGAIPFDLPAGTEQWWQIDAGDGAYWAVQENINAIRAAAGLGPLSMDGGLSAIASGRCQSFVAGGPFDHSGMVTSSEICACGPLGSAGAVCSAWQGSPAHYAAMTGNFSSMGVGCWFCSTPEGNYTYWCVTFG